MQKVSLTAEDTRQGQWEQITQRPEGTEGCCISGPQRLPGSDDRHQVAARCNRALWTTIEEPGVQAKRGKAFKRTCLVLIPRASCRHVEKFMEEGGGGCEDCRGPGGGVAHEIRLAVGGTSGTRLWRGCDSHRATSPGMAWRGTHSPSCGLKDLRKKHRFNLCPGHRPKADVSKHT